MNILLRLFPYIVSITAIVIPFLSKCVEQKTAVKLKELEVLKPNALACIHKLTETYASVQCGFPATSFCAAAYEVMALYDDEEITRPLSALISALDHGYSKSQCDHYFLSVLSAISKTNSAPPKK